MTLEDKLMNLEEKMNTDPSHFEGMYAKFSFDLNDKDEKWSVEFEGDHVEL